MASDGTLVCPVCDAVLEAGAKRCRSCNTDLTLFDLDKDGALDLDKIKVKSKEEIDAFLRSLSEGGGADTEKLKNIAEGTEIGGSGEGGVVFECPSCGAEVDAAATKCPSCGAEFAEEAVCPKCGAAVNAGAEACSQCGATFAPATAKHRPGPNVRPLLEEARKARAAAGESEEVADRKTLYKELPKLVSEVKPLLLIGRDLGADMAGAKTLINEAIAHGKSRDIERAVKLVREAKLALHLAFTDEIVRLLDPVVRSLAAGDVGAKEAEVEAALRSTITVLKDGGYQEAFQRARALVESFPATATAGPNRAAAGKSVENAERLLGDASALGVKLPEAETQVGDAKKALAEGRYDDAARSAGQARALLLKPLAGRLDTAMKSARDRLIDMKARGRNFTRQVGLLKQVSLHLKREEYDSAAHYLRLFDEEMRRGK